MAALASGPGSGRLRLELTTAWNVNAAYEHFWNPRWRTSLYGGYARSTYGARPMRSCALPNGIGTGPGGAQRHSHGRVRQ